MTTSIASEPLHLHVAGWSGTSHSIALVNQWQTLALSRRPDVRLSKDDIPPPLSADEVFSPAEQARLAAIPQLAAGVVPDVEIRTPFFARPEPTKHPVLAFAVAETRGSTLRKKALQLMSEGRDGPRVVNTPSKWVRDGLIEQGVPAEEILVVPHGANTAVFRPTQTTRLSVRKHFGLDRFTFLHVGAMVHVKGMDLLLRAAAVLLQRGLKVQVMLKGQDTIYRAREWLGAIKARLSETERALLEDNCIYFGQSLDMPSMAALYNAADAYVASYRAEGFCLPVLEAAACGLPIIATAGGATDDFTTDDFRWSINSRLTQTEYGELLEPDLDHLIELMSRMVTARDFHNRASKAGPRHVAANYTWDHVAGRIVDTVRGMR